MKKLVIPVHRSAYSVYGCNGAITVRDLIERLEDYDEDTQIYFSHDNGYTYGALTMYDLQDADAEYWDDED